MSVAWTSFGVIIFTQFIFFVLSAVYYKKLQDIPRLLLLGIILGTAIGLLYDILLGKYLGLFSYTLGFNTTFLLLNASLSYGLFLATTLLVQNASAIRFVVWLSVLIVIYEIANVFFPVWAYTFSLPLLPSFILCIVGYSSGALLASAIARTLFKHPFALKIETRQI